MNGVTVKKVDKLIRHGAAGAHLDDRNLYLVVNSPNAAHWELRYQLDGKSHQMGLGSARNFSLEEARARARAARQSLDDGIDPLAARRGERAAAKAEAGKLFTFAEAARGFLKQHEAKWGNARHAVQWHNTLAEYVLPILGPLSVAAIDVPLVLRVLEQKLEAGRGYEADSFWKTRTETASRVRSRIESVLDWATARGYRSGDNPAAWKTIGKVLPPKSKTKIEHHPALPYDQLPAFMAELRQREGTAASALIFTILTAARSGEVLGARWPEIDLEKGVWTVPAGRMKASREHRVPLSQAAVKLLRDLPTEQGNDFVFVGPRAGGLSDPSMAALLGRMGRADVTVHGFRSCFRDWAAEQTAFPHDVVEMALAHTVGSKVEVAYKRTDLFEKRRKLMAAWATFCASPPARAEKEGAEVVALRARATK
jgi:integrase